MEENQGWIHLFRKFTNWEWYDCPNVKIVFLHCLLMANHKTGKWQGITIKRGQFVSSYEKIAAANGLSVQQVRTSIKKLKNTHEINTQTTNLYTLISVNNYDLYQSTLTDKQQSNNKQLTTNKNEKNIDSNTSYIISSSSSIEKTISELSEEDEEILKSISKRNGIKYFKRWLKKIVENNDHIELLKQEKHKNLIREERKKEKIKEQKQEEITPEEEKKIKLIQEKIKKGLRKK